jgi:superfamily II DNA or RNA helicase
MIIQLKHSYTKNLDNVFDNVTSVHELISTITRHGGDSKSEGYTDRIGMSWEVFVEFYLSRFGSDSRLHVHNLNHTSYNKYQVGYDFTAENATHEQMLVQAKFHSDPTYKFKRTDLQSFSSISEESDVAPKNRILITNLDNSSSIFSMGYNGNKLFKVYDINFIRFDVERDPEFWNDFRQSILESGKAPEIGMPYELRPHQVEACQICEDKVLSQETGRGRVKIATGGGKTSIAYRNICDMFFKHSANVQVIVAPTLALIKQHREDFKKWGLFHREQVVELHFSSIADAKDDDFSTFEQTMNEHNLLKLLEEYKGRKVLIFTTYCSERKLFDLLRDNSINVDLISFDEYHHLITQTQDDYNHIVTLPSSRCLFYSASEKRGEIVSSLNPELFGERLIDVSYSYLREQGILVPRIDIRFIRLNKESKTIKLLTKEWKNAAFDDGYNPDVAIFETAAIMRAYCDMLAHNEKVNIVTFSKKVDICKKINESEFVKSQLGEDVHLATIHAAVPSEQRKNIFNRCKTSIKSILCQYSIVKEGIDCTAFNALVLSRVLDQIGLQQAIGRIVRAEPQDRENLKNGKITLDKPEGWIKYNATVYIVVHDDEMDAFGVTLEDIIRKLHGAGIDDDHLTYDYVQEERHGIEQDLSEGIAESLMEKFSIDKIRQEVHSIYENIVIEEQFEEEYELAKRMSIKELCESY